MGRPRRWHFGAPEVMPPDRYRATPKGDRSALPRGVQTANPATAAAQDELPVALTQVSLDVASIGRTAGEPLVESIRDGASSLPIIRELAAQVEAALGGLPVGKLTEVLRGSPERTQSTWFAMPSAGDNPWRSVEYSMAVGGRWRPSETNSSSSCVLGLPAEPKVNLTTAAVAPGRRLRQPAGAEG